MAQPKGEGRSDARETGECQAYPAGRALTRPVRLQPALLPIFMTFRGSFFAFLSDFFVLPPDFLC